MERPLPLVRITQTPGSGLRDWFQYLSSELGALRARTRSERKRKRARGRWFFVLIWLNGEVFWAAGSLL